MLDDLFSSQAERDAAKLERVREISLEELHPFKEHPFKIQSGEEMHRMIESIRKYGTLTPGLARPSPEGGYELVSGHRRLAACQALGMETMPVIVRDMTDDEAVCSPPDFSSFLRWDQKPLRKELAERTAKYSIFEPVKNRTVTGFVRYETHSLNGDFECCKTLADSPLEQVVSDRFVKGRKPRRRKGLRTFLSVSARGDLNRPKAQIKPRSCVKSRRSCAFARSQARKQRSRQRR